LLAIGKPMKQSYRGQAPSHTACLARWSGCE